MAPATAVCLRSRTRPRRRGAAAAPAFGLDHRVDGCADPPRAARNRPRHDRQARSDRHRTRHADRDPGRQRIVPHHGEGAVQPDPREGHRLPDGRDGAAGDRGRSGGRARPRRRCDGEHRRSVRALGRSGRDRCPRRHAGRSAPRLVPLDAVPPRSRPGAAASVQLLGVSRALPVGGVLPVPDRLARRKRLHRHDPDHAGTLRKPGRRVVRRPAAR